MGRRSDHTRDELKQLIVETGWALMGETGYARFSAREVGKRIGYSVGTLYNVFEDLDRIVLSINGHTLDVWADFLEAELEASASAPDKDRIHALVRSYFRFAARHTRCWAALYDHRLPQDVPMPDWYREKLDRLFAILEREIGAVLPPGSPRGPELARTLFAAVHGICALAINGTMAAVGTSDAKATAMRLVDVALRDAGAMR